MNELARHATEAVLWQLGFMRAVVVTGARQVGKSTLARQVLDRVGGTYLTLDEPATLAAALSDPDGLIAGTGGLTVIDEVQRAPDLLRAVKLSVDRDQRPGRFLLTGSANLLRLRTVSESLAGRAGYLELLPLSWSEIVGAPRPASISHAFAAPSAAEFLQLLAPPPPGAAQAARELALTGGMPATLGLDPPSRRAWYDSYRVTFLERDLRQLSKIASIPEFGRLMTLALLRSGGLLNKSDLASDAGLSYSTTDRYLSLLQVAYQVRLLQPFFVNVGKRLVKSPRVFAVDSGAVAWAANLTDWRSAVSSAKEGALLETFALSDIRAWDGLSGESRYHFWRTSGGAEVDLIIEHGEHVVGVEVKGAATLNGRDLRGLRGLRDDLGPRFKLGILAYLGEDAVVLDPGLVAVPLASLLGAARPR
jgi:predicted AAA+ superfamily ATPase